MELIDLMNSIINDLTQMANFRTQIPASGFHSPALANFVISSDLSICSTLAFPLLENSDCVVFSVSIDVTSN